MLRLNSLFSGIELGEERMTISIRDAFCCKEGTLFVSADYSQLEMRILAHCANDESLIRFFKSGNDFFRLIARYDTLLYYTHNNNRSHIYLLFLSRYLGKVHPEDVTKAERDDAKKVCYGILYGQGIKGRTTSSCSLMHVLFLRIIRVNTFIALSQQLEKSDKETKQFMDRFHNKFPRIKQFLENTKTEARLTGNVRTELDRLRLLPDINSASAQDRASAERQVNT